MFLLKRVNFTMKKIYARLGAVAIAILVIANSPRLAFADDLWSGVDCVQSTAFMFGNIYKSVVYVYVESDFASEMAQCTPTQTDNNGNLAETDARHRIDEALEIWNQQGTGVTFHYAGDLNVETIEQAKQTPGLKTPAVFVNFYPGCREKDPNVCTTNGVAATALRNSAQWSSITVWGDPNTPDACGTNGFNWNLRSDSSVTPILKRVMAHELGHIAGLGHSNGPTGEPESSCTSANQPCTEDAMMFSGANVFVHLRSWDKHCARRLDEQLFWGRSLERRTMFFANPLSSYYYYGAITHPYRTKRGMISGGALDNYYALFDSSGYVDYDVAPSVPNSVSFSSANSTATEFSNANVPPTFWSGYGTITNQHHAFTLKEGIPLSTLPPFEYDPPRVRESGSSNRFSTTTSSSINLRYRTGTGNSFVATHLPISVAFDPRTNQNIFVWVETKVPTNGRHNGEIYVHPGFYSAPNILNTGAILSPSTTSPPTGTHPAGFTWDLETDNIVGVACGDEFWTATYNCLLAWQDRGMPWGRILYTYFRVGASNQVDWMGTAHVLTDSQTSTGVQAAYTGGQFRMVWKSWLGTNFIVEARLVSSYYTWWLYSRYEELVVDAPTFLYRSHDPYPALDRNHAITWTRATEY